MDPLPYEPRPSPTELTIQVMPGVDGEIVVHIPPPPAWRERVFMVFLGAVAIACLCSLYVALRDVARFGLTLTNGSNAFRAFFFAGLSVTAFVFVARDREPVHTFRIRRDALRVVRRSTAGEITGDWTPAELKSVEAVLGPRLASGRHDTRLRITLTDGGTIDLMAGHPITEIRTVEKLIRERFGA